MGPSDEIIKIIIKLQKIIRTFLECKKKLFLRLSKVQEMIISIENNIKRNFDYKKLNVSIYHKYTIKCDIIKTILL